MGVSKFTVDGIAQIDISQDTVSVENLYAGESAVAASGDKIFGEAQGDNEDALLEKTISGVYSNNSITAVRSNAFHRQYGLTKVILPNVTSVAYQAFYNCTGLETVNAKNLEFISRYAFYNCTSLSSLYFPNIFSIEDHCFQNCSSLTSLVAPTLMGFGSSNVWNGSDTFSGCSNLITIDFPRVGWQGSVRHNSFLNCTKLTNVNLPLCTALGGPYIFKGCTSLPGLVLPSYGSNPWITGTGDAYGISTSWFEGDTSLEFLDIKNPYNIKDNAFKNCSNLSILIFRGDRIPALSNVNAFSGTPFASGGSGGTIYITEEMYSHLGDGSSLDYQNATNWSTVYGYGTITWEKIENSYYETHYGDGRLIADVSMLYPELLSLNGTWDYGANGTITVTNNNHITLNALKDYGGSGFLQIYRADGKPIFTVPGWSKFELKHPTADEIAVNGGINFCLKDGTVWSTRYGVGSWEQNFQYPDKLDVEIYSIGFKKYWKGTLEYDLELYMNDIRII